MGLVPAMAEPLSAALHPQLLLVEDEPALRHLVRLLLEDAGCCVTAVQTPADAVCLLLAMPFDVVLTTDGCRRLDAIRAATTSLLVAAGSTPVLLFTAFSVQREQARSLGFAGVVLKPFDIDQ